MTTIYEIEARIIEKIKVISKDRFDIRVFFGKPSVGSENLYLYSEGDYYIFGYQERGKKNVMKETTDPDEIMYEIIKEIVFHEASGFEVKNRMKYEDHRRLMFEKELELMKKIDPDYYNRLRQEAEEILKRSPYDDNLAITFDCMDDYKRILKAFDSRLFFRIKYRNLFKQLRQIFNDIHSGDYVEKSRYFEFFKETTLKLNILLIELNKIRNQRTDDLLNELKYSLNMANRAI